MKNSPRADLADTIAKALTDHYHYLGRPATVTVGLNTSGCPLIKVVLPSGKTDPKSLCVCLHGKPAWAGCTCGSVDRAALLDRKLGNSFNVTVTRARS